MDERIRIEANIVKGEERFYIDLVKGAAIFLMLYGHCIQYCTAGSNITFSENWIFKIIYSFHMPLFMLVSGYLFFFSFSKYKLRELLPRRIQSLVQPIVCGSILMFFVSEVTVAAIRGNYGSILDGKWMEKLPSLWFLWSVLSSSIVVIIVGKTIKNETLRVFVLLLSSAAVVLFPNAAENIFMYPYFLVGFYYAQYRERLQPFQKLKHLSLILYPVLLSVYTKSYGFVYDGLSEMASTFEVFYAYVLKWAVGLAGSIVALMFIQLFNSKLEHKAAGKRICVWLVNLGKKSLQIYVLSVPLLSSFLSVAFPLVHRYFNMENVFAQNMQVYNFLFTPALAIVYAFGLYHVVHLLERWKISPILFGR